MFLEVRWQALDMLERTERYLLTLTHMGARVVITVLKSIKLGREKIMELCGLCSTKQELRKSHLLPKSFYKRLKEGFEGDHIVTSDPGNKTIYYSSLQVKETFLCDVCEGKFSKHGENHVADYCHGKNGGFPLLDKMRLAKAIYIEKDKEFFLAENLNVNQDGFYYFALSVLWRSANWPNPKYKLNGSLGAYDNPIKEYLKEIKCKPKGVYVGVYADASSDIFPFLSFPTSTKKSGYHHHIFYLPGLKFSILIGNNIVNIKKTFQKFNTRVLFVKYYFRSHRDFSLLEDTLKSKLKATGKLAN